MTDLKPKWKDLRKWSHFERTNTRVSGYFKGCSVPTATVQPTAEGEQGEPNV